MSAMMMRRYDVEQRYIYQKRLADRDAVNSLNIDVGDCLGSISLELWYRYRNIVIDILKNAPMRKFRLTG